MNKKTVAAILLLCGGIIMNIGCIDDQIEIIPEVLEEESSQAPPYEDKLFLEWLSSFTHTSNIYDDEIIRHAQNSDFKNLELSGILIQSHYIQGLTDFNQFNQFNLSPELRPFCQEFKKYLEDRYQYGVYMESGWGNMNHEDMDICLEYGERAFTRMRIANIHLSKYSEDINL